MTKATEQPGLAPRHDILTHYRARLEYDGGVLYVRALSDLDLDDREKYALITSAQARRALGDESTSDYGAHIAPLADFSDEELRLRIEIERMGTTWQEVWLEMPDNAAAAPELPISPEATLEEREQSVIAPLLAEESHAAALERRRQTLYDQKMRETRERLAASPRDALLKEAAALVVAGRASVAYRGAARRALVVLATYTDAGCTERRWDLAAHPQIPPALQNELADKYAEVGNVSLRFLTVRY